MRTFDTITAREALDRRAAFDAIIDVRSEAEFALDRFPDAVNCPVLDNQQRIEIGTMYKVSAFEARKRGAALVARNIARHLDERFSAMPRSWSPLVYCWRGGQRSASMAHVFAQIGWRVSLLEGGYRSYRRQVVLDLEALPARLRFVVICGSTGAGKSRLLASLTGSSAQVLDLESLACHRGSVLGLDPNTPQPSQKAFESRIYDALVSFETRKPIFVESESARIGTLRVPPALLAAMHAGACVRLETDLEDRLVLLAEEYRYLMQDSGELFKRLDLLTELHGRAAITRWKALAAQGAWPAFIETVLREHYDPAYARSMPRNFQGFRSAPVVKVSLHEDPAMRAVVAELLNRFDSQCD